MGRHPISTLTRHLVEEHSGVPQMRKGNSNVHVTSCPKIAINIIHSRGAKPGGGATVSVSHVQVSVAQAFFKAAGSALEAPMGCSDPMMVKNSDFKRRHFG